MLVPVSLSNVAISNKGWTKPVFHYLFAAIFLSLIVSFSPFPFPFCFGKTGALPVKYELCIFEGKL